MTFRNAMRLAGSTRGGAVGFGWVAMSLALVLIAPTAWAQDLATLGESKISVAEARDIAQKNPELRKQLTSDQPSFENTLRQVLLQRAILREAQSKGWDKRPEVASRIEEARNAVIVSTYLSSVAEVPSNYPSDGDVSAAFEQNKSRIFTPWAYHLAQIFVKRPAEQGQAEEAAKRAARLAGQARAPKADFTALAKAESEDTQSKDKGGDTGWVFESSLLPELRPVVPHLKPGEISDPIPSAQGWHIVKLLESRPPAPATLDEAKGAMANTLRADRAAKLRQVYLDSLVEKTPLKMDQPALAKLRDELSKSQ